MNMNQFTQKTVEALQRAQSLAIEYQHMQVEQEHLMAALLGGPQRPDFPAAHANGA